MIFHHPLPVGPDAKAASGIRPFQMIEAFRSLGFEVDVVAGHAADRARAIAAVDRNLAQGLRYDFLYGESSTEPTLLTESHHLPIAPFLDFGFFARLKAQPVPLGLFYRDIYWRFSQYGSSLPWWKEAAAKLFYRYDLIQYRRLLDRLYLPSMAMARYVPWVRPGQMRELPPGFIDRPLVHRPGTALRLLYVGGLGAHYQLHELFRALGDLPGVELTLCTREAEWRAVQHEYPLPAVGNIRIVHRSGAELIELFEGADACVLCVKPHPYWAFAAPVKLYEYIGALTPVIASAGTLAGDFVERHDVGWSVPCEAQAIKSLLQGLLANRARVGEKVAALRRIRDEHTWQARARQVAADLTARG
jgi:glycosyltransferase involved in cell wall biosynthesis